MNLEFTNTDGDKFSLGSVSFGYLDKKNIFDRYQENTVFDADCIFKCTRNLDQLSKDIDTAILNEPEVRLDIKNKLINFSAFIKISTGVSAFIL